MYSGAYKVFKKSIKAQSLGFILEGFNLSKLYTVNPLKELIKYFGIWEKSPTDLLNSLRKEDWLLYLKNYSELSNKKLVEQLNGNME